MPFQTAQMLQSYAIKLMAYQFDILYKATKELGNADGLSRLTTQIDPAFDKVKNSKNSEMVCNITEAMIGFSLSHNDISRETLKKIT